MDEFAEEEPVKRMAVSAEVCFLVTMLEIGVVRSFVNDPEMKPMASSSKTGSTTAAFPSLEVLAAILLCRRKVYARKNRKESAMVFPVSCNNPV